MKTPEYKGPAKLPTGPYDALLAKIGDPPKGYRFLKIGETTLSTDFCTLWGDGAWGLVDGWSGKIITTKSWPHIRKVDYVRGPKGRFVSAEPAPKVELTEATKAEFRDEDLSRLKKELESLKDCLSGKRKTTDLIFWYRNTAQGYEYWTKGGSDARCFNPLKPEDRPFFEALKECLEAEIARKTPKVVPAPKPKKEKPLVTIYAEGTGPSRKYRVEHGGAQLEEGDKELLKGIDAFRSVRKELADLKARKAKVLAAI